MYDKNIRLVDCPRDAIQGIKSIIPTEKKIAYINALMASNLFDFIDFGSFVSPTAVPQMADTHAVVDGIIKNAHTKLIAIIANEQGARMGADHDKIDYFGYPFSLSDTFQRRNTNRSMDEAFDTILACKEIIMRGQGELMVYLSMAFGNPYGDTWHPDTVLAWVDKLVGIGIRKFSVADTTAEADPTRINTLFTLLYHAYPDIDWSIHLHSRVENAQDKVAAAYAAGCRTFEGAIMGYGGCPFAQDDLVGNIPTELLLRMFKSTDEHTVYELMESFQKLLRNAV